MSGQLLLLYFTINWFTLHTAAYLACDEINEYYLLGSKEKCWENPNIASNTPDMIRRNNYPITEHAVTTSDGYILKLFRIPNDSSISGQPVFLQHGAFQTSDIWVDIGNESLAFQLSQQGYDIWLGNSRGNRYSSQHETLRANSQTYWNFTLDDYAINDMKAIMDYIHQSTQKQVTFIGHSMGTTEGIIYNIEFGDEKILNGLILLAPGIYSPDNALIRVGSFFLKWLLDFGFDHVGFTTKFMADIFYYFCSTSSISWKICKFVLDETWGPDIGDNYKSKNLPLMFSYSLDKYALKPLVQITQWLWSDRFQKYDYKSKGNMEMYGEKEPPIYDLKKVDVPVYLFHGAVDYLATPENVQRLFDELIGEKYIIEVGDDKIRFNHGDFLYSKYLEKLLYPQIFDTVEVLRNKTTSIK